jgi:hypothetical protein
MATAMIAAMAKMYLRFECLGFFGWSASERFFLHLPDFVLSLSFDHLPFFTRGTGKNHTSLVNFSSSRSYIFNTRLVCTSFLVKVFGCARRKLKLSLFFYWKLLLRFQAVEEKVSN